MKQLAVLLLCLAFALASVALGEEEKSPAQALIERAVVTYAAYGETDTESLDALKELDPALADKWAAVMDIWQTPVEVNETLPDDLPGDDSLCLVVLGFQLNPDGTMRDELIQRLTVALECSRQYPNAFIVCTGGGTAPNAPEATEAGRMAAWLIENGVDEARVFVENRSMTTAQNAIFTFQILAENAPQVKQLAIISSDYHIFTGALLFGAQAVLTDSDIRVTSNAAWKAPSGSLSAMFQAGAIIELSGDVETAYDIYFETYDIHELPSREAVKQ